MKKNQQNVKQQLFQLLFKIPKLHPVPHRTIEVAFHYKSRFLRIICMGACVTLYIRYCCSKTWPKKWDTCSWYQNSSSCCVFRIRYYAGIKISGSCFFGAGNPITVRQLLNAGETGKKGCGRTIDFHYKSLWIPPFDKLMWFSLTVLLVGSV